GGGRGGGGGGVGGWVGGGVGGWGGGWGAGLQNRGLQVRFLPGLFSIRLSHRALPGDACRSCHPLFPTAPWIAPWPAHSRAPALAPRDRSSDPQFPALLRAGRLTLLEGCRHA